VGIGEYLYNCVKLQEVATRGGFTKLGVEKIGALFTRGVLVDVAGAKGKDMLEPDYEITVADLQEGLRRSGQTITPGAAVLIRTGWGRLWMKDNARFNSGEPGIGIGAAEWLASMNPILVGSDNWGVEVYPNPDARIRAPVHQIMVATNGIFLLENLDLEELARDRVVEFAFVIQPLKMKGASGSTVAPIAVK
jgi:kynurenine formamidase